MTKQLSLFRMPAAKEIALTRAQREVLAWVEYSGGRVSVWPRKFQTQTLRFLIAEKLVQCTAYSPARYVLTSLGRAVRSQRKIYGDSDLFEGA